MTWTPIGTLSIKEEFFLVTYKKKKISYYKSLFLCLILLLIPERPDQFNLKKIMFEQFSDAF